MNNKILLAKSITLLFRESQLSDKAEKSNDLVRTVIESIQLPEINLGVNTERDIINGLKELALEMCADPVDHEYDKDVLLQRLKMITDTDDRTYEAFAQGIENEQEVSAVKRTVTNLQRALNNHFREVTINDVLNKASYQFKHQRDKIKDVNQFIAELCGQLEPLQIQTSTRDPAVLDDIDIGDNGQTTAIFSKVKDSDNGGGILKTGWHALNRALLGGFRRGKQYVTLALQHNYKTGLTLSLFEQIARYNVPMMIDESKKPLLLRISFEDEIQDNMQFLYQILREDLVGQKIDFSEFDPEEMSAYVREKLQVNGYHIKMLRVDPTQWTYKNICNKIVELEAQGYEIHLLMLDYLSKIPTTGCIQGPMGADLRDLFQRMRGFCAPRGICTITPHQLSTDAKGIVRSGIPPENFVKEINSKGYYEGSKQIDQVVDGEIYIFKFVHGSPKETYLSFQVGKHRIPKIAPDEDKYFILKFPKWTPIPADINGADTSMKKPGEVETEEELFSFSTSAI